jgi:4-hydroxy-3-methylbut-2-enyl diphosphate reductase IspH
MLDRRKRYSRPQHKANRQVGKITITLGIISQTTQTQSAFTEFVGQLTSMIGPRIEERRLVNTLCKVTQDQQEAAVRLARRIPLMIVIGGSNSTNAKYLVEICSPLLETHLIETSDEVDNSWLVGKHHMVLL